MPIFKKESKLSSGNHRPVYLLLNVEKILEKLKYKKVYNILTENNIIYGLHFSFRQNFSKDKFLLKDILDVVYLWTCQKLLTQYIIKYCYLDLNIMVLEVYQIIGLNPTFLIANNLFL